MGLPPPHDRHTSRAFGFSRFAHIFKMFDECFFVFSFCARSETEGHTHQQTAAKSTKKHHRHKSMIGLHLLEGGAAV